MCPTLTNYPEIKEKDQIALTSQKHHRHDASCRFYRFDASLSSSCTRELKIDDAATPRRGVNIYDKKKDFWNLMFVTTV